MLNLLELERRWLHYKIKLWTPYIFIIIILAISVILFLYWERLFPKTIQNIRENNISIKTQTTTPEENLMDQVQVAKIQPVTKQNITIVKSNALPLSSSVKFQPSMNFMNNIKVHDNIQNQKQNANITQKEEIKTPTPIKHVQHKKIKKIEQISNNALKITIKKEETRKDLKQIIARFQNNKNPALSLFIAKNYYALGNYKQSYNYALITNQLNQDIEESWIIFAKSLVKLNKKIDAIKTLQKYIDYSHSSTAAILLDDIRTGKFK